MILLADMQIRSAILVLGLVSQTVAQSPGECSKLTDLSYYRGLNAILGPLSLTSDSALTSLAGTEVCLMASFNITFRVFIVWMLYGWS